ncbi:ABC transporter substrate-binding protein, partial [Borreliella americana]|nr:ABC transporter substrate-binding protein [Borreliella americana]
LKMLEYFSSFLNKKQMDLQKDFFNKYGYLKLNKILLNKKSLLIAGLSDITFYNSLSEQEKAQIKFSYLINDNNEIVISNPNFIGILETSALTKKFINWILDKKTQKILIGFNNKSPSNICFGFANGFTPYKGLNLKIKNSIAGISPFIIDETQINSHSYVLSKKTIEKANLLINEWFFSKINNLKKNKN